jgi:hypothetical protein
VLALVSVLGAHCRWGYLDALLLDEPTQPTSHLPDAGELPSEPTEPAPSGTTCNDASALDCDSCNSAQCPSPACSNGVQDGSETGTDCGGACPA